MSSRIRRLGAYVAIIKVVVLLVAIDYWVKGPFFGRYIVPRYVSPFVLVRDRTGGHNLRIMFDVLRRLPRAAIRVALIGDSTMNAADCVDQMTIPYLVGSGVRRYLKREDVLTIDSSEIGMYASDAVLFIAKLLGTRTDVIVYGVSLREFPRETVSQYVSRISDEMSLADLVRIVRAGGGRWLANNVDAQHLMTGLVKSNWATYAYRTSLREVAWDGTIRRLLGDQDLLARLQPLPVEQRVQEAPRVKTGSPYEWTRAQYGMPSQNWAVLELIGQLCHDYAPGRCVMYTGAINPLGREQLAEPGFYEEYLARLRVVAGRYGLIWRDYTDTMTPADFKKPKYGGLRDPIHLNETGRAKLAALLVEPVSEALQSVIAPPQRSKS